MGQDNIFTFGASSDEVIGLYANGGYHPWITTTVPASNIWWTSCRTPQMLSIGDPQMLWARWNDMKYKDWFMAPAGCGELHRREGARLTAYEDRTAWAKKMLVNIARSGYFSSDRTIAQYDADIWHLRPAKD